MEPNREAAIDAAYTNARAALVAAFTGVIEALAESGADEGEIEDCLHDLSGDCRSEAMARWLRKQRAGRQP